MNIKKIILKIQNIALRTWPAFTELKKKIDDFLDSCGLLELMASDSMKDRHWDRLQNILSTTLDVESPAFLLGDLMQAPLLPNKDDIEDVCVGANKEKDIEAKLKQVIAEWSIVNLQLAMFKGRELLIKAQEAMEIVGLLDDNIMILNSLATNR